MHPENTIEKKIAQTQPWEGEWWIVFVALWLFYARYIFREIHHAFLNKSVQQAAW